MRRFRLKRLLLSCLVIASPVHAERLVTDQNGRQVRLPDTVSRVAGLIIPAASMVITVDQGPARLVGINPSARQEIDEGLIGRIFPAARSIRSDVVGEGFVPNVESLLAARPDLVIQWGDRGNALIDPISKLGLPVLSLRYGSSELAAEWLQLFGTSLNGREARGRELATRFLAVRASIARAASAIPVQRRPRVVYLYRMQGNAFQVAGNKTSMDSDIGLAGGVNVAAHLSGFVPISAEQLLAWKPDVVLLNNFEKDTRPSMLYANTLLASLPAVKERRVYVYPQGGFRWDPPSQESPLAWRWLFTLFHPAAASPSLRDAIVESYHALYGYAATSADIDRVLRMTENGESRHYREKFTARKGGI